MSANTAAKIAYGIADSLLTNGVAQAAKAKIPIYIYPADQDEGSVTTILPDGKEMTLYMRDVDIENADRLKRMQEITVLESIKEIEGVVRRHIEGM
jgi:flavoprotein